MSDTYQYDAFISYRHLSPDKPVAERLQKLLETYVPPKGVLPEGEKKKLHLFRDETELPTSNDLGGDIKRALENARYLVVICTPNFEKSKWCMEEVTYFKQLHGGSNRNILTLLADDPDHRPAFPEILRFETVTETLETGETVQTQKEIEPLAANVSAKTRPQMLKKLKTEFLRIAAPLLGCKYDDLYQREQRRKTRRKLQIAFGSAAVLAVAALLSTSALITIQSQKKQIEADALALRENNAQLQLRESEILKKDGDLLGALAAAVNAFPEEDDGTVVLPGTLAHTATLTGAYEPFSFAPVRKIALSSIPQRIYLLENGTRLLAVTSAGAELADAETGEILKTLPGATRYKTAVYRCPLVDKVTVTSYSKNMAAQDNNGLYVGFRKDLLEETQPEPDAFYLLDDDTQTVARIDPKTGEALWRTDPLGGFGRLPLDTVPANEALPFLTSENDFLLLDPDTGKTDAVLSNEETQAALGQISVKDFYYLQGHLIFTFKEEGNLRFAVFRKEETGFSFLYDVTLLEGDTLARTNFMIHDGTIAAVLEHYPGVFDVVTRFMGFELASGRQKWLYEETDTTGDVSFIGYIPPEEGSGSPFGVEFAVNGDHLFAVNADTGALITHTRLPGTVRNMYYTRSGFVFISADNGVELFTTLRRFTGDPEEDDVHLYLNSSYGVKFARSAHGNNVYAVSRGEETAVLIYRPIDNDAAQTLYACDADSSTSLTAAYVSPDASLAALQTYRPYEIMLMDLQTKEIRHTFSYGEEIIKDAFFMGNGAFAVQLYDRLEIYSTQTGEIMQTVTDEDYKLDNLIHGDSDVLFLYSNYEAKIYSLRPGEELKQVTDCAFAAEGITDKDTRVYLDKAYSSPAGDKLFLFLYVPVKEEGQDKMRNRLRMAVYDIAAQKAVMCAVPGDDDFNKVYNNRKTACAFSGDGSTVYLLLNKNLLAYACDTGALTGSAELNVDAVDLTQVGSAPCILTPDAVLIRMEFKDGTAAESGRISFGGTPTNGKLSYTSTGNGAGVLRYMNNAWLIDESAFAYTAEIERFAGLDTVNRRVYQTYNSMLLSYPLYDEAGLLARAEARLSDGK